MLDKFCNYTINVSEGERDTALQHKVTAPRKSILIYNGITKTNREFAPDQSSFVIGTTARLEPQKDPWTFFHIAKEIVTTCDNVKFVYVGDGSMRNEITQAIKEHQLEDKIILTGFQRNPMEIVQTFDLYLITSLYEGMPYSVLEALNYGLPLVATDVIGNNEVVKDGYNGYLFGAREVNEGVQKIISIMNDPLLAAKFASNSRQLFEQKFQIEHMLSSLEVVYDVARPEQVLLESNHTISSYS